MAQRMHEIAVHACKTQHKVDWEAATVKQVRQTTHEGLLKLYTSESKKQHPTLTAPAPKPSMANLHLPTQKSQPPLNS